MSNEIISFENAIKISEKYKQRHLLLGNGFAISCMPEKFLYKSILQNANFDKYPEVKRAFELVGTNDFELVSNSLANAAIILPAYMSQTELELINKMKSDSEKIKEILIETITNHHPDYPAKITEDQFRACRKFLAYFLDKQVKGKKVEGAIYTVSYDLLLYWTLMHKEENELYKLEPCDGFGKDTFNLDDDYFVSSYVTWQGESRANEQNTHYLHGALHLYDLGKDIQKYTWANTGETLIDQARLALNQGKFPIFVSEGESDKKLAKIKHSAYLFHSFKSFSTRMSQKAKEGACLFTFGFSFSENDKHIFNKIAQGRIPHIFVGIKGKLEDDSNKILRETTQRLKTSRQSEHTLEITYYDADSANVWGFNNV